MCHMQGVSPIEECGWKIGQYRKRTRGVESSIDKYSTIIKLIFTFDWGVTDLIPVRNYVWSALAVECPLAVSVRLCICHISCRMNHLY